MHYLQIDKALLSCIVLLKQHTTPWNRDILKFKCNYGDNEIKQMLDQLRMEKMTRDKLESEIYQIKEQQVQSKEKINYNYMKSAI